MSSQLLSDSERAFQDNVKMWYHIFGDGIKSRVSLTAKQWNWVQAILDKNGVA